MDLQKLKDRIRIEGRRGDAVAACAVVGVTPVVFRTAMKKDNYADLTQAEEDVLAEMKLRLDRRLETKKMILNPEPLT